MATSETLSGETAFDRATTQVCNAFGIKALYGKQKEALQSFFSKRDVFVNLPTCYGKSLIFQAVPMMADIIQNRDSGSSVMIVISPLKSLMEDQVRSLKKLGIAAVCVTEEHDDNLVQRIINGEFTHVYGSPECLLTSTWRGILTTKKFKESLVCIAVDEAHCISQWGLPDTGSKKVAFRQWYGNLSELRSLIPDSVNLMVVTATATKQTRHVIFESLKLNKECVIISESPNRSNLFYCVQYFRKDLPLNILFADLINEIKMHHMTARRTIIYCQTRKQCGLLFRVFEVTLGNKFYKGSSPKPTRRLVEMYHAGTPSSVKKHISKNFSKPDGHIRILIATIAFGMGINCQDVQSVIHFGPSKHIECYVQESGRAGRNGALSECIILYNGNLLAKCCQEIKELILDEEECRRKVLLQAFGYKCQELQPKHSCCDNCIKVCQCLEWPSHVGLQVPEHDSCPSDFGKTRSVTDGDKKVLTGKLKSFHDTLLQGHASAMSNTVSIPLAITEFGSTQMNQVLNNCHKIFSVKDVENHVDVWRKGHAHGILKAVNDVFGDIQEMTELADDIDIDDAWGCTGTWNEMSNDSSFFTFNDSQDLEEMEFENTLESEGSAHNSSSFLNNLSNNITVSEEYLEFGQS